MAGSTISCPNRGCPWEQWHQFASSAIKALDKHRPKCRWTARN